MQRLIEFANEVRDALLAIPKNLSDLRETVEKQTGVIHDARSTYEQSHSTTPILRAELQVPHPLEVQTYPRDKHAGRETFKLVASTLTLIFVAAYTVITFCMARATDKSIALAEENAHREQRAWVAVSDIAPSSNTKGPWEITITFKNTGHTPAKNFTIKLAPDAVNKGSKPIAEEEARPGHGVIPPEGFFHSALTAESPYDWKAVDLVIHGTITYDSVFGHSHWTKFCYDFAPKSMASREGNFAPCETGNDVDSNDP